MLAKKNVKWIYKGKGNVKKGDLAALLHRLDTGNTWCCLAAPQATGSPATGRSRGPAGPSPGSGRRTMEGTTTVEGAASGSRQLYLKVHITQLHCWV